MTGLPPETIGDLVQRGESKALEALEPERRAAVLDRTQDTVLKRKVALFTMWATAVQAGMADVVFLVYAASQWRNMPVAAIDVWLGAAVVQVIGLMAIVSHYLFPNRDG